MKMPEATKKSTRERKPPAHLMNEIYNADNQDQPINSQITRRRISRHRSVNNTINTAAKQLVNFIKTINMLYRQSIAQNQKDKLIQKMQEEEIHLDNFPKSKRDTNQQNSINKPKKQAQNLDADTLRGEKIEYLQQEQKYKNKRFQQSFQGQKEYQLQKSSQPQFPCYPAIPSSNSAFRVYNTQKKSPRSQANIRLEQTSKLVNQSNQPQLIRQIVPQQNAYDIIRDTKTNFEKNQQSNQIAQHKPILTRTSYHVGAAYYTHIKQNKTKTLQDLDPIAFSRKTRHQSQLQYNRQQQMRFNRNAQTTIIAIQNMQIQQQFPEQKQINLPKNIDFEEMVFEPQMQKMQEENETKDKKENNIDEYKSNIMKQ